MLFLLDFGFLFVFFLHGYSGWDVQLLGYSVLKNQKLDFD